MSHVKVTLEWRRGETGEDGTYVFSPKPNITRTSPGRRAVELTIPLRDGVVVQNQGIDKRNILLRGVLYNKDNSWDTMETLRNNLRDGIGVGPGQLHIVSPQRHIRYDGQIAVTGVQFGEQSRSNIQDYTISILVPNGLEINVTDSEQTIQSSAEIA